MELSKSAYKFWNKHREPDQHEVIAGPVAWQDSVKLANTHRQFIETKIIHEYLSSISQSSQGGMQKAVVAEVGCGTGRLLKAFIPDYYVAGFDISPAMIKGAKKYLSKEAINVLCLEQVYYKDGRILPLEESEIRYNLMFSFLMFQHLQTIEEVESYIRAMANALKPGGYLRVQTYKGTPVEPGTFGGFHGHFFPSLDEFVSKFTAHPELSIIASEEGIGHKDWLWVTACRRG